MKVLLAEDDTDLRNLIAGSLKDAHFTPDLVASAEEASYRLKTNIYDLAILDWCFAGEKLEGIDLLNQIRKSKKNDLPVIMLTAKSALIDRVNGISSGADDYLMKPFHMPELIARANALLRRGHIQTNNAREISAGDLVLDTFSYSVTHKGKPLSLNNKEFQLLKLLLVNIGDVLTRVDMIEKIWGDTEGRMISNTVDVHIRRLRQKLGKLGKAIRTVRGIGYRFDPC